MPNTNLFVRRNRKGGNANEKISFIKKRDMYHTKPFDAN